MYSLSGERNVTSLEVILQPEHYYDQLDVSEHSRMTGFAVLLIVLCWMYLGVSRVSTTRHARVDADILIGVLFPIHREPPVRVAFTRQCGEIWEQYGIHRVEVLLHTLDEINNNSKLLPNVSLGSDIRDSCWYAPVALERSIDFIKNSISSLERLSSNNSGQSECAMQQYDQPIAGLIGPASSTVSIQVQNLLSLFHIPQIGYSATSKTLSAPEYFLRVVPSDTLQARALADLVKYNNWTYISTVYTEGDYGFRGMEEFISMIKKDGICQATENKIENTAPDEAYDNVIRQLLSAPSARVVVCFCEGMTVHGLLKATKRMNVAGRFLFIGSDGWAVRPDVVANIENAAAGGISMKLYSPPIKNFEDHYFLLRPYTNRRNPWFQEFWQQKFNCYLEGPNRQTKYTEPCTGNEDLSTDYVQDAKLGFVINAIYTMAYALDNMHRDLCAGKPGLCAAMKPINGTVFRNYLLNVSFTSYSNDRIEFNKDGDPPGRYDIMNYQKFVSDNGTVRYDYVRIGGWDNGNLTLESNKMYWPDGGAANAKNRIESICSKPCPHGQVKETQGASQCCWSCKACQNHEFMLDAATCKGCALGWWPNQNLTACVIITIEHIQWGDREAVVAMGLACTGLLATLCVALVFVCHNNTTVVKASTRELSYIILLGIAISYSTTFPLVAKPSLLTCYLARVLPGLSFSLIYGALVTKTNRIARILAGSKKRITTRKPRFMSASAQVVITCIIIGMECAIVTAMLIIEPADSKLVYPSMETVQLTCNATTLGILVPLSFDIFLIVMCTLYAVKTRNLPENFNEAKFIGFTMYTTCVIWVAFVPIYFGSDNKVLTMSLAISLSATVALALLFFRKIYIIVYRPEKNNRSAFTTTKEVRCHIGSAGARSSNDSADTFQNAALAIYHQRNILKRWKRKSAAPLRCNVGVTPTSIRAKQSTSDGAMSAGRASRGPPNNRQRCSNDANIMAASASIAAVAVPPAFCTLLNNRKSDLNGTRPAVSLEQRTYDERGIQTDYTLLEPLVCRLRRRTARTNRLSGDSKQVRVEGEKLNSTSREYSAELSTIADTSPLLTGNGHAQTNMTHVDSTPGLMFANESTALLYTDEMESSSEDTLSDHEYYEPLDDDIDELLSKVCPTVGSFSSSTAQDATASHSRHGDGQGGRLTISHMAATEPHGVVVIHIGNVEGQTVAHASNNSQNTQSSNNSFAKQSDTPNTRVSTEPVRHMSTSLPAANKLTNKCDNFTDMTHSAPAQPLNDMSIATGDRRADIQNKGRFKKYLKEKGIDLDMNSIQTSDV